MATIENNQVERFFAIDCIRVIAIMCVVLNHTVETNYPFIYESMHLESIHTKVFAYTLFTTGRLGVPLFLMISGFLLLNRKYDYKAGMQFYKRNFLGLFITMMIWCVIYNIFIAYFFNKQFSITLLLKNIFLVENVRLAHMWYMPVILGIYLFLPLLANGLKSIELKTLEIPMIISFVYLFILPIINVFLKDVWLMNLSICFSAYPFILTIGYLIRRDDFDNISCRSLLILFSGGYMATIILQLLALHFGKIYNVWYDCGLLLVASVSLFLLLQRYVTGKAQVSIYKTIIAKLANYSFGVYLLHMFFILVLNKYIKGSRSFKTVMVFVLSVICSYILAFAIGKIRLLRKPLFFIK